MFHTLSEQMKRDQQASQSFLERSLEWAASWRSPLRFSPFSIS